MISSLDTQTHCAVRHSKHTQLSQTWSSEPPTPACLLCTAFYRTCVLAECTRPLANLWSVSAHLDQVVAAAQDAAGEAGAAVAQQEGQGGEEAVFGGVAEEPAAEEPTGSPPPATQPPPEAAPEAAAPEPEQKAGSSGSTPAAAPGGTSSSKPTLLPLPKKRAITVNKVGGHRIDQLSINS